MKISQAHYQHMLQSIKAVCPSRLALAIIADLIGLAILVSSIGALCWLGAVMSQ